MERLKRIASKIYTYNRGITCWLGNLALLSVTMIIVIDVGGRFFFGKPLEGSLELVELNMMLLSGFAVVYTAVRNKHLKTDLLNTKLSASAQRVLERTGSFLGFVLWGVLAYEMILRTMKIYEGHEVTVTLHIIRWPFVIIASVMMVVYSLILLKQAIKPEQEAWEKIEL